VQQDIIASLHLRDPEVLLASFNRPNIAYSVLFKDAAPPRPGGGGDDGDGNSGPEGGAFRQLLALLREALPGGGRWRPGQDGAEQEEGRAEGRQQAQAQDSSRSGGGGGGGCAIVYALKRRTVSGLAARLSAAGLAAGAYHAGLPARERAAALDAWRAGRIAVCVATVAFGMGVDKPDGARLPGGSSAAAGPRGRRAPRRSALRRPALLHLKPRGTPPPTLIPPAPAT
jgi:hypothetical protein